MSEEKVYLSKLAEDGSNWVTYHNHMQWTMKMRGLCDHLMNATTSKSYTDAGDVGGLNPAQQWARDQTKASKLLDATIPNGVFLKLKDTDNVKEVWDQLKKEFEGKSRSVMVGLGRKLQTTHCGEDDDVCAHFTKLAHLHEQLLALGRDINDDEYVATLIGSLPSCYDIPINSLTATCNINNVNITLTTVTQAVIQEYEKRSLDKENKSQEEAFTATKTNKKKSKKDVECFNCKKKGHYKSECWVKGGGNEGGGPKKTQDKGKFKTTNGRDNASAAKAESSSEDKFWAVIVEVDDAPSEGEPYDLQSALIASSALTKTETELYDSGASQHMSPFQHHFTHLHSIPPRAITAANNRVFYATGLGDLGIDVPNGSSSTRIILKDTLYAPDMSLTVVSISKITDAGYTVSFEGKGCKIKNKNGKTIGKIPASVNGLYRVEHPVTAAAAQEQVDILTVHWRLGHISANSIHSLVHANAVTRLQPIDLTFPFSCDSCEHAKATRKII